MVFLIVLSLHGSSSPRPWRIESQLFKEERSNKNTFHRLGTHHVPGMELGSSHNSVLNPARDLQGTTIVSVHRRLIKLNSSSQITRIHRAGARI